MLTHPTHNSLCDLVLASQPCSLRGRRVGYNLQRDQVVREPARSRGHPTLMKGHPAPRNVTVHRSGTRLVPSTGAMRDQLVFASFRAWEET